MVEELPAFVPVEPTPSGPAPVTTPPGPPSPTMFVPPAEWRPPEPPAPRPRMARKFVVLIVSGITVVALVLVGGIVASVVLVTRSVESMGPHPLVEGETPSAAAEEPLSCPDNCFSAGSIAGTILPEASFTRLGLTEHDVKWGDFAYTTPLQEHEIAAQGWTDAGAGPDSCFFLYSAAPMVSSLDSPPAQSTDTIDFTGTHNDQYGLASLSQVVRVFDSSQSAVDHMSSMETALLACPSYETHVQRDVHTTSVTMAPAVTVPSSVAAIGWVEDSDGFRYYSFDVQRANIVVRTYLSTAGPVSEEEFRALVVDVAAKVGDLQPTAAAASTTPTDCAQACLGVEQAASLMPTQEELDRVGSFAVDTVSGSLAATNVGTLQDTAWITYDEGDGAPAVCFFTLATAPISPDSPSEMFDERDDIAIPLGIYTGRDDSMLTEAVRVYDSELYAGRYIRALKLPLDQCGTFAYQDGGARRPVVLTPVSVDTGVAGVVGAGWLETWGSQQRNVVDLQYKNVTMRIVLERGSSSRVTDEQFAEYVSVVAARMHALG